MPNKPLGLISWIMFCCTSIIGVSAMRFDEFGLNVKEVILQNGYPLKNHRVTTEDGYILEMQRIPYSKTNKNQSRQSVLLMPGAACDSAVYINNGPENALGYILADAGYDVWLGNYRGTTWSRAHVKLNPNKDKQFWDYSAHEISLYDTQTFIDYILETTKQDALFYIGHSQGGMGYILLSEKPEYNKKIRLMVLLAPVSFMQNSKAAYLQVFSTFRKEVLRMLQKMRMYEIFAYSPLAGMIMRRVCDPLFDYSIICDIVYLLVNGKSSKPIGRAIMPRLFNNLPAGGSVKEFNYLLQLYESDSLFKYDYGTAENLIRYGQPKPPVYNVTAVTAPVAFYYGDRDASVNALDTSRTADMFPNVVANVLLEGFGHMDFLWGIDVKVKVHDAIIDLMRNF